MTVDLAKLIERLEAATGPDRDADAAIWAIQNGHDPCRSIEWREESGADWYQHYTSSIDSAMTLVPENWRADSIRRETGTGYACVWGNHGNRSANAPTPALALCIAALKARLQSGGGNG